MTDALVSRAGSSVQMEKFTGADLTEICQRAAKIAIRENIMKVGARCGCTGLLGFVLSSAHGCGVVSLATRS